MSSTLADGRAANVELYINVLIRLLICYKKIIGGSKLAVTLYKQ